MGLDTVAPPDAGRLGGSHGAEPIDKARRIVTTCETDDECVGILRVIVEAGRAFNALEKMKRDAIAIRRNETLTHCRATCGARD